MTNPNDDAPAAEGDDVRVRTSLKLRPEVHRYFRERALAQRISLQKLIENLCEGAYHEWSDLQAGRVARKARRDA
jgi:hypothetical protein